MRVGVPASDKAENPRAGLLEDNTVNITALTLGDSWSREIEVPNASL